jgi:hypothetical protein
MVPFKNHRERIGIAGLKVPHYALIIEDKEFGIRHAVVAIAGTNSWKTHGYVAARIYHMDGREITRENYFLEWDKMRFQAVYQQWVRTRWLAAPGKRLEKVAR